MSLGHALQFDSVISLSLYIILMQETMEIPPHTICMAKSSNLLISLDLSLCRTGCMVYRGMDVHLYNGEQKWSDPCM